VSAPFIEWCLRQLVVNGYAAVQSDSSIIDGLLRKYPDSSREMLKTYIEEHPNIQVINNYPNSDVPLPHVSILTSGGAEDAAKDTLGDLFGTDDVLNDDGEIGAVSHAVGYAKTVEILVAVTTGDVDGQLTNLLFEVFSGLIYLHKWVLDTKGLRNLRLDERSFQFDQSLLPAFATSRALLVFGELEHTFDLAKAAGLPAVVGWDSQPGWDGIYGRISGVRMNLIDGATGITLTAP